jgi:HTH-type transcriptional regulator/antitoxin HigA
MNAATQAIKHWSYIFPYAHVPRNESEYEKMLGFIDELMALSRLKKDEQVTSLLNLIAKNIEKYESHHYTTKKASPIEMLLFLMEENHLSQNDLPEIGSQSLVSKILNGERHLTTDHIKKLSERFGVSPSVFI